MPTDTITSTEAHLQTQIDLLTARIADQQRTIDIQDSRITELGEALTSLGHPPQALVLHLDEIARSNARAAADSRTAANFRDALRTTVVSVESRRGSVRSADLLADLLYRLRQLDTAATKQLVANRHDVRSHVIHRRAQIAELINHSGRAEHPQDVPA